MPAKFGLSFADCRNRLDRARKRRKVVIDVDAWQPPEHLDDFKIRDDPVALGECYARVFLKDAKRLDADVTVPPLELCNARCALEAMAALDDMARRQQLESLERHILKSLEGLPDKEWRSFSRPNVRPHNTDSSDQFSLGLLPSQGGRFGAVPMPSIKTLQLPSLCVALNLYLKIAATNETAATEISTIQVLRNFQSRPHVDGNNKGESWSLCFGSYEGGGIWVLDDKGDEPLRLKQDVKGPSREVRYKASREPYLGRVLDTHRFPKKFDGNVRVQDSARCK